MGRILDSVEKFYDQTFGNKDGKFTLKDLPNGAPAIVALVVDLVMLVAEYRVWSVGYALTGNPFLAFGFVAVSSLPFYLGQLAFLYNQANLIQKAISVAMVMLGLGISAYFGFAEFLIGTTINTGTAQVNPVDPSTLYAIAIGGTVALILGGLVYGLVDDIIAQNLKAARIRAKANAAKHEIEIKKELLREIKGLRLEEEGLKTSYPEDYDHLNRQFNKPRNEVPSPRPVAGGGASNQALTQMPRPSMPTPTPTPNNNGGSGKKSVFETPVATRQFPEIATLASKENIDEDHPTKLPR